jgi:hypothetical protein
MDELFGTNDEVEAVVGEITAPSTSKLRSMFKHYLNNCSEHREDAFRDRRYFDGDQISEAWQKNLEANDMPMVPINLIKDNIAAHIGMVAAQQTEIRAFSRTQEGAPAAEVATKLLRYAIDSAQIERKFREASESFFIEGVGAVLIECDNKRVYCTLIDYRDFAYDPNSRRSDFSDARWLGFSRWLPADEIADAYPEAFARLLPSGDTSDFTTLDNDRGFQKDTDHDTWINDQKMVRVIEMYYLDAGQWMNAVWCHKGVLDHGPSQYTDDYGVSVCPIVPQACHTKTAPDAKNARYGQVRNLIYPQDDYNARRHAALKYLMSKTIQLMDPNGQPVDHTTLRAEAQKRITIMPPGYQMQDTSVSGEQVQFMQMAGAEIQRMSPAAAVAGTSLPDDASGRSRQVAAAGGQLPLAPVMGRVQDWREAIYRHVWYRVNQYWRAPMQIRITGDTYAPKYLQINVPQIDEAQPEVAQLVMGDDGQPVFDPTTGEPQIQMVPNIIGTENEVAKMDMDFKITTQAQHDNLESEVWGALMQLMSSLAIRPGTPEFRMALDWAPIPNKSEVIERYDSQMAKMAQENAAQSELQQQVAQMQQQLSMLLDKSKADKDASSAAVNHAKAERTALETAMLSDNLNKQHELEEVIKQQFFR